MFQEKVTFKNSLNLKLAGVFEGLSKKNPLIILCHGYASSKDSASVESLAEELVKENFSVFRFDFTGNGESEGDLLQFSPLQGLDDLKSAISFLGVTTFGLYANSTGGHVALLYSAENPVTALALRASVVSYETVTGDRERAERFLKNLHGIDVYEKCKDCLVPLLLVHGELDEAIPISQVKKLYEIWQGEKQLEVIEDYPHSFRGEALKKTNQLIVKFFSKNLRSLSK